jgi:hypothetical protein
MFKVLTVSIIGALASAVLVASPARAAEARWGLHNSNAPGAVDASFGWGSTAECNAIVGDWDGDGTDTPGGVCAKPNGEWQWSMHNANAGGAVEFFFGWGSSGCLALVGDWDGNGTATPGTVCASGAEWHWKLHNANASAGFDADFGWGGTSGCWPIVGDWDGNRTRTPGLVCPNGGEWHWRLHNANAGGGVEADFGWGSTSCSPIWGDWDGNGSETPGTLCGKANGEYQWGLHNFNAPGAVEANFGWGSTTQRAVIGDWDGNGSMTPGTTTLGINSGGGGPLPAPGADLCARTGFDAGWRGETLVTAVAIGLAESSCRPDAHGSNGPTSGCPNGSIDRGLWQINNCYHREVSDACAYEARCNAREAFRISGVGSNFNPWSTYKSGAYRSRLTEARAAVNRLP